MFDPLNFTKGARVKDVRRWRESELVHGRVAMLAALGFIVGEQLEDFPAFLNADGHITGPAIYQFQQVEARGAIFVSTKPHPCWAVLLVTNSRSARLHGSPSMPRRQHVHHTRPPAWQDSLHDLQESVYGGGVCMQPSPALTAPPLLLRRPLLPRL